MPTQSQFLRALPILALALALVPETVFGQEDPNRRPGWELSVFAGGLDDSPEFAEPADGEGVFDPESKWMFGGFLGYSWASGFFVEGEAATQKMLLVPAGVTSEEITMGLFGLDVGWGLPIGSRFLAFADVGPGLARWSPENFGSETDFMMSYGLGGKLYLSNNVAFRVDGKFRQVPAALGPTFEALGATDPDETLWASSVTFGLNVKFGGGVGDSDGDGVNDDLDQCPNTPMGAPVDAVGCPIDSDGDGVFDYQDDCPNTPAGVRVNARGCPVDSDGDGVFDGPDECPGTPRGTEVDSVGCPVQAATPPPPPPTERRNEPVVAPAPRPVTFDPIYFAFDSAELDAEARAELDEIGRQLSERADDPIEIRGHTDRVGTPVYNMALSQRRARAARDYLIANFPALADADFSIRGFGYGQPAVSVEAQERRNRRVIVYVGTR